MIETDFIKLPNRASKPRTFGLNFLLDNGLPTQKFIDVIESHSELIDSVKFGWGTALVTKDLMTKVSCLRKNGIGYQLGGTLFEKAVIQGKVGEFVSFCKKIEVPYVEVSDGTIEMPIQDRRNYIKELSKEFKVLTEVGYKDVERSKLLSPSSWIDLMKSDFESGAVYVITESRESGTSGICRENGELRFGLIEEIRASGLDLNKIVFEAPNKSLQTYFIKKMGANVNLGNISFNDVVALETLRLGLRSDTLYFFEEEG